jgi:hypothetical protein
LRISLVPFALVKNGPISCKNPTPIDEHPGPALASHNFDHEPVYSQSLENFLGPHQQLCSNLNMTLILCNSLLLENR